MSFLLRNIRLLFLATLVLVTPLLKAQGIEDKLPAKFVRITTMEDITDDGYYLIGSIGGNKHFAYFLSSISTKNKLKAIYYGDSFEDIISEERTSNIWRFKHVEGNKYYIQTAVDNMNLFAGKSEKLNNAETDIGVSENVASNWLISINDDNTFRIANSEVTDRFLSIYETEKNNSYFSNQKWHDDEPGNLFIFKLATDFNQLPGNAVKPADGERLTVTTGDKLPSTKFTGRSFEDFLLHNGVVAPDDELASFTVTAAADDMFTLKSDDGQFLQYNMKLSETETKWQIYNGHIATIEKTPRYLVYINKDHSFIVLSTTDATLKLAIPTYFQPIGESPSQTNEAGVLTLSGAWSPKRLAEINLEGVSAIDLSEISLPIHCNSFTNYPQEANIPIYVSEEDAELVPETWNFVVAGNQLLRETILYDRKPLEVPKEIAFDDKQIKYKRTPIGDDGWETLCLPFDAELPKDYIFEEYKYIDNNNLIFSEINSITSNKPLIFARCAEGQSLDIIIEAKAGSLKKYETSGDEVFIGTFKRITVGKDDTNLYFLYDDGNTFTLAAEGSGLSPFRAYIKLNRASNSPLFINHAITGINTPKTDIQKKAFTIDGRKADVQNAGRGIYIVNGKKTIITKP